MIAYFSGVLLFAVGIAVTIALHEFGHFATACAFHMRVRRFFIGFGPTLFSVKRGHTTYGFKAIPLGGFCDIAGMTNQDEVSAEEAPHAMRSKPAWQRVIVLLGGIAMNLIVAFIVLYGIAVSSGLPNPDADYRAKVGEVGCVPAQQIDAQTLSKCTGSGPAEEAGIRPGDTITAIDGHEMDNFVAVREYLLTRPGESVTLSVERGEEHLDIPVEVARATRLDKEGNPVEVGAIGVSGAPISNPFKSYDPLTAVPATARFNAELIGASVKGLVAFPAKIPGVAASLFGAERDAEGPMSVVGVSRVGGELVERSMWPSFFMMLASLNVFLALFNLVPVPPLDGGHVAVVIYEKIRDALRKARGLPAAGPADYEKLMPLTIAMTGVLLLVGVLVIAADVVNPIRLF